MSAAWYNFSALGKMKSQLKKHGLPLPPMDWVKRYSLSELRDWVWGSRTEEFRIYELEKYAEESLHHPACDYFMLGHDGYGVNAWYLNVLVQYKFLTVLIQAPWGGAYSSGEVAVEGLRKRFAVLEQLLSVVQNMEAAGLTVPGRLIIQQSSQTDPRWAWVEDGVPFFWHEEFANAMTPALESLKQKLSTSPETSPVVSIRV